MKQICVFLAVLACLQSIHMVVSATEREINITSSGAIVIDFTTGMELYSHNADVRRGPASMTKMMSVYLVYEAIANGTIGFDTIVPISSYAYEISRRKGETNVPLSRSGVYTVDELLDVVIVMSAGGATAALAELIAGTTREFRVLMNAKVEEWGIDATFNSVSGGTSSTKLTPRAMAVITRNTLMDFPEVLEKTSMESVTFEGREYPSTNLLLGVYDGIDGFKTGTHPDTGANFSGTAQRGSVRIIIVTMGSTYNGRFPDTEALLDYGFEMMREYRRESFEEREIAPSWSSIKADRAKFEFDNHINEAETTHDTIAERPLPTVAEPWSDPAVTERNHTSEERHNEGPPFLMILFFILCGGGILCAGGALVFLSINRKTGV